MGGVGHITDGVGFDPARRDLRLAFPVKCGEGKASLLRCFYVEKGFPVNQIHDFLQLSIRQVRHLLPAPKRNKFREGAAQFVSRYRI